MRRQRKYVMNKIHPYLKGKVLDIGCGNQDMKHLIIINKSRYIGVDYPATMAKGYSGHPDVFGDAQCLPFKNECADVVLLLDVLEHIPCPHKAFSEAVRVVKDDGIVIVKTPFMYPLHDVPHDFQRWTKYGLMNLARSHDLSIIALTSLGGAFRTAATVANLALAERSLESIRMRHFSAFFFPIVLFIIFGVNLLGFLCESVYPRGDFMALGYLAIFRKSSY